ncbi:MAG: hypothetical protein KJN70_03505 [Eudoraea sp.]|nr:hypothetical protein [Eudoraea sp.]
MDEFTQKLVLLGVTAVLSGFLIPFIMKQIEGNRHREQKYLEAELARQGKLIDAQAELLAEFATCVWEYEFRVVAVTYYRGVTDKELYLSALTKYDETVIETLVRIRTAISKALYLTSPETYQKMRNLYFEKLLSLDRKLRALIESEHESPISQDDWHELNRYAVRELADYTDQVLESLALDLKLKQGNTSERNRQSNKQIQPTQKTRG